MSVGGWFWPWRRSTRLLVGLALGVAVSHAAYRYAYVWSPFQRLYLSHYIYSRVASLVFTDGDYRVLHVITKRDSRLALPPEAEPSPEDDATMRPTPFATEHGVLRVAWVVERFEHRWLHKMLCDYFYDGQRLSDLVWPSLWTVPVVLGMGAVALLALDLGREQRRRRVRLLRGPMLVSARTFNRRLRGGGLGIVQAPDWLARRRGRPVVAQLPASLEAGHLLVMGDAGSGAPTLIGQLLDQIRARGDTAIVYDPSCAYVGSCYQPDRGDVLLNPLDARCPCWSPADEIDTHADMAALAGAMVASELRDREFITEPARQMLAQLVAHRPNAQTLADWLTDRDERVRRLGGVLPDVMTHPSWIRDAGRVDATLGAIGDALRLLPTPDEVSGRWSARTWAARREGWVFLTTRATARDSLRTLAHLWLDLLLLRLQTMNMATGRRVWVVLDGVETVDRLAHLPTAITQASTANVRVIVGCQGRRQIDAMYGALAEPMLAQPAIKAFLRTAETPAAQWASDMIGRVEVETFRERAWPDSERGRRERQMVPLVLPTDIANLPPLRGYLAVRNLVARLDIQSEPTTRARQEPFIERPMPPRPGRSADRGAGAAVSAVAAAGASEPATGAVRSDDEPFFR